jgi:D-alanyl-D-alanine carboxypeptidase
MRSSKRAALAGLAMLLPIATASLEPVVAGPVILLDAESGRVLYAEDQDHQWYPASLTKMMTAYIAFEEIKAGSLQPTDMVGVSETAFVQPPSKLGLPVGAEITVDMALRVLIVKSANDVAVMLAERLGGSVEGFAVRMNATARRLGMTSTNFVNPHGLPAAEQVSSARDLAHLARAVLRDFPERDAMWAMSEVRVGKLQLRSHNALLRGYEGADGIKTGFICDSGFNVVASASRNGRRLVAVVLGEPSGKDRNLRAASLLEHGFVTADWKAMLGTPTIESLPVDAAAKPVASVRTSVTAWNCNPVRAARKSPRRRGNDQATARNAKAPAKPAKAVGEKAARAAASAKATTAKQ